MRIQSLALLAGATTAIAAETVTLFLPGFDEQRIEGKVIGTSGSMTKYLIKCATDVDETECGIPYDGMTVAQGSSTVSLGYSMDSMTIAESCKYDATSVSCGATFDESGTISSWNSKVAITEIPGGALMPVTITATGSDSSSATTGASVSASTAASTSGATLTTSASTSDSTATGTNTATGTATASDSSDSSSAAATSQTETDNAAMPMITGNARWAAGGVAAALAIAAL
ncbi:hypothetical protein E8E15_009292 [Penicillium rubens]|uniref:Pc21g05910 protein n=2 Tax=Penicillium chrysogenum species complex TaxID=254878 RepID=B6HIE8_PENRW|nr:uncharacterized protein N7525_007067 [Penicillium rubens]XP_056570908.1 uncharacterized protein N7489_000851 [Penicillium chrysogenum]CAP95488.1 Pc21g05910 [Penicillium rubens Wisconsin 54-1255]KAF3028162.1 hypothetical protein E8E15_009292 [Penicillium rubens]KAJ5049534.1 hypothetical protein NUH16_008053 [Penicillium rubens]KAJ5250441.1 hypothetical protein N7489_000851 [Penicillium chrysogenum]KAJ5269343.1 hypothetical protein N7505_005101 [Penicillium chrysogenum]